MYYRLTADSFRHENGILKYHVHQTSHFTLGNTKPRPGFLWSSTWFCLSRRHATMLSGKDIDIRWLLDAGYTMNAPEEYYYITELQKKNELQNIMHYDKTIPKERLVFDWWIDDPYWRNSDQVTTDSPYHFYTVLPYDLVTIKLSRCITARKFFNSTYVTDPDITILDALPTGYNTDTPQQILLRDIAANYFSLVKPME